ncbi:MAG: hypothetical protein ABJF11_15765 [Reichenbachiella sp.]|uniref:hypothetical protein n=1 Tax=Reichenbachiella sp. TaxID=2184521 RepID=UPI003263F016
MKLKNLITLVSLSLLMISCGSDDDNNDPYADVPSSEIVELELRDAALSGSASSSGRTQAVGQKWWKQKVSKVDLSGECGDNEDQEVTDGYYYGFYPAGEYYYKLDMDATPIRVGSWQWADSDKDAIIISSIEFDLRGLNDDELIISSDQSQATCTVITWEQFDQPFEE